MLAKHELRDAGILTPDGLSFNETAFKELGAADALDAVEARFGFPLVIKPADQGSALGIKFAASAAEVPAALVSAFSYPRKVLLERCVPGREFAVSILDGVALPVVEAVPVDGHRYDFAARYTIGRTRFACPAELPAEVTARAQDLALRANDALGCRGVSCVELMRDGATSELWVLEVNAIPGFTETSLLPLAAEAVGIDFDDLVARILALAV